MNKENAFHDMASILQAIKPFNRDETEKVQDWIDEIMLVANTVGLY